MPKHAIVISYAVTLCLFSSIEMGQALAEEASKPETKAVVQAPAADANAKKVAPQGLDLQKLESMLDSTNNANGPVGPNPNNAHQAGVKNESCPSVDPVELKTLLKLRDRRLELDSREHALAAREQELNQSKQKIQERLDTLDAAILKLETKLELGEPRRKMKEEQMKNLADSISNLSAKKSAPILSEADPDTVARLLLRLGSARMASLLAAMPSAKAARIINIVGKDKQTGSISSKAGKNGANSRKGASGVRP